MIKFQKKSLKVGRYVGDEHANTLIRNYRNERWVHNSRRLGKADSMSCWYSAEELKEFLDTCQAHGADGIRIHFGAYPAIFPEKPKYAGRQTVLLMATKTRETANGPVEKNVYIQRDGRMQVLAYNVAKLCPPDCQYETPTTLPLDKAGIPMAESSRNETLLV